MDTTTLAIVTIVAMVVMTFVLLRWSSRSKRNMQEEIRRRTAERKAKVEARRRKTKPWGF